MKFFKVLALGWFLILILGFQSPDLVALAANKVSTKAIALQCIASSQVIDSTLEIDYTPECLEQNYHLSEQLKIGETTIQQITGDRVHLSNLRYALIQDGIQVKADIQLNPKPVPGSLSGSFSQDLALSIQDGILQVHAEKTDIQNSKLLGEKVIPLLYEVALNKAETISSQPQIEAITSGDRESRNCPTLWRNSSKEVQYSQDK